MGRGSTNENKNIYWQARESLNLSREAASEKTGISEYRIERIETEKMIPTPYDILQISRGYNCPELCHHFCTDICEIGREYIPKIEMKDLSQIVLEMLASLNAMDKKKNRLIEITVDGQIGEDEIDDFIEIQEELEKISIAVDTLKLWVNKTQAESKIDMEAYKKDKTK